MLGLVRLVGRFNELERELPADWAEARLVLTVADDALSDRAAALLGPANPGRLGNKIRFTVARRGAGIAPEATRRLLRRLDMENIRAQLDVVGTREAPAAAIGRRAGLREQWEQALAPLPSDWSDVYAEVRFSSTDYVERGALLLSPLNPSRYGGATGLRFRCAQTFGYGVSPEMAARCFERCDEEGLTGDVEVLRTLSDTNPVGTQGPVWLVGGRSV